MKKRMSKRIVCSVLASAVFMAQLQMPSVEMNAYAIEEVAETEAENLIQNGDFETGDLTGWTAESRITVKKDEWAKNNTTNFLHIGELKNDKESSVISISQKVKAAKGKWKISVDQAGLNEGVSGLSLIVKSGDTELGKVVLPATTDWDNWKTVECPFELATEQEVTVEISGNVPKAYWGDFDNITLTQVKDPVLSTIQIDSIEGIDENFITGVDVSSYISEINSGVKYYDYDGNLLDEQGFFNFLKENGVNWVRLRVWNDPYNAQGKGYGGGNNDVEKAIQMGKWATDAGIKVLIDFHYSDFWTDPGKQVAPKAWEGKSVEEKAQLLYDFTYDSLKQMLAAGVNVGMVQVGNETNNGIAGEKHEGEWEKTTPLFAAGCNAVHQVAKDNGKEILAAVHFADPQVEDAYATYAAKLDAANVNYDVFASSYYPFFHGTTDNLTTVLTNIAKTYGKKVMVAETSWATTLEEGDGHDNQIRVGTNDTQHYDFSVYGQAHEVRTVLQAVKDVDKTVPGAALGGFYWEPAWLPVNDISGLTGSAKDEAIAANKKAWEEHGSGWAASYGGEYQVDAATWYGGSSMDNQAMFDFDGKPLESLKVFKFVHTGSYVDPSAEKVVSGVVVDRAVVVETQNTTAETKTAIQNALPNEGMIHYTDATEEGGVIEWDQDDIQRAVYGGAGRYVISGTLVGKEVRCELTLRPKNLLPDGSFENGGKDWTINNMSVTGEDPRTWSKSLHFWFETGAEKMSASQTVELKGGYYRMGAFLQGAVKEEMGENSEFTFTVEVDGKVAEKVVFETPIGWNNWREAFVKLSVPKKETEDGKEETTKVTITLTGTNLGAGAWGGFDDAYIYEEEPPVIPVIPVEPSTPETPDVSTPGVTENTETKEDGTVVDTKVEVKEDGSSVTTKVETATDGSTVTTEEIVNADGSKVSSVETVKDGTKVTTEEVVKADGSTESRKEEIMANGTTVKTEEIVNADGSMLSSKKTTTANGSNERKLETAADGAKVSTVVRTKKDGSSVASVTSKDADGAMVRTITKKAVDGTTESASSKKEKNESGKTVMKVTKTQTDANGKKVSIKESSKIVVSAKTSVLVNVQKNAAGNISKTAASISVVKDSFANNDQIAIAGDVLEQIVEQTKRRNTMVTTSVKDAKGKVLFKLNLNAYDAMSGADLKLYRVTKDGKKTRVDKNVYRANAKGNIFVNGKKNCTYELSR